MLSLYAKAQKKKRETCNAWVCELYTATLPAQSGLRSELDNNIVTRLRV